jgi:signal peptidase I
VKPLRLIASTLASALCVFAILVAGGYGLLGHLGYRAEPVLSGSMEPTMSVGSLAIVKQIDAADAERGDVVMFETPGQKGALTTHRISGIEHEGGSQIAYRTRGDANETDDPWQLAPRGSMGKLVVDVPYAGYAAKWLEKPNIRTGIVIIGALLALLIILRRIWREEPVEAEGHSAQTKRPTAVGSAS